MGALPARLAVEGAREWLALPGGGIRPVVSAFDEDGRIELLTPAAWYARLVPSCEYCGRPRLGSGRTCGGADCVARARAGGPG